ncbi:hypothetical protein BH09ACT8_BH09ACT8_32910 [soil metagenome]
MVTLTRIYTRTGDGGTTRLGDLSEVSKLDPRLEAYATVDETNAHIGVALSLPGIEDAVGAVLLHIQNDLFDVGADLSTPVAPDPKHLPVRVTQDYVDRLETWCDEFNELMEPLPQSAFRSAVHPRPPQQSRIRRRSVGAGRSSVLSRPDDDD